MKNINIQQKNSLLNETPFGFYIKLSRNFMLCFQSIFSTNVPSFSNKFKQEYFVNACFNETYDTFIYFGKIELGYPGSIKLGYSKLGYLNFEPDTRNPGTWNPDIWNPSIRNPCIQNSGTLKPTTKTRYQIATKLLLWFFLNKFTDADTNLPLNN